MATAAIMYWCATPAPEVGLEMYDLDNFKAGQAGGGVGFSISLGWAVAQWQSIVLTCQGSGSVPGTPSLEAPGVK